VKWGRPGCLLQSAGGEANRIFFASVLSSMHIYAQIGQSARLDYSSEFGLLRWRFGLVVTRWLRST